MNNLEKLVFSFIVKFKSSNSSDLTYIDTYLYIKKIIYRVFVIKVSENWEIIRILTKWVKLDFKLLNKNV